MRPDTKGGENMEHTLKSARVKAELSRPAVIKRLMAEFGIKITIGTLASYENKATQPDIITAKALASIYGLSVDDIIFM